MCEPPMRNLSSLVLMAITHEKSTGGCYSGDHFQKRREREGEDYGRRGMTCGVHLSASGGGDAGTLSGWRVAGPRAESGAGLNGLPRPFYPFL
jgi:hypothetical protein